MKLTYACFVAALAFSSCTKESLLSPAEQLTTKASASRGAREGADSTTATGTTYTNESSADYDAFFTPRLFSGVPGSLNRTLVGTYDKDYNAFQAIAGVTYTVALSKFNVNNPYLQTVRLVGYLPNVVPLFRTSDGILSAQFTATQSVVHTIVVEDQNSDTNFGNSLGDYTITVTSNGPVQQTFHLSSLTLSAASVKGGTSLTGTVGLSGPAPAGGVSVALTSHSSGVGVPSTVVVPAGSTNQPFTITTTTPARSSQLAAVVAKYNDRTLGVNFTITRR